LVPFFFYIYLSFTYIGPVFLYL